MTTDQKMLIEALAAALAELLGQLNHNAPRKKRPPNAANEARSARYRARVAAAKEYLLSLAPTTRRDALRLAIADGLGYHASVVAWTELVRDGALRLDAVTGEYRKEVGGL